MLFTAPLRSIFRLLAALAAAAAFCGAAQGQIAFRAQASAGVPFVADIFHVAAGSTGSREDCGDIVPTIPGGNVNDLLIALVVAREDGAAVTMAGWNTYFSDTFPAQEFKVFIFWRLATAGGPSTVTQSGTCSSFAAQISRFRNVDMTQPFETDPILAANWVRQTSDNLDTGTENTNNASAMALIAGFVMDDQEPAPASGWSASFSSKFDVARDATISLHYKLQTTAGAISESNWDLSGSGAIPNYGVVFALRPAELHVNKPAGTVQGDVMVASIAWRPETPTVTPPTGWTLVRQTTNSTGDKSRLATYYKVAGASEPSRYVWSFSGGDSLGAVGGIATFSGVDTSSPINVENGNETVVASTHTANQVSTTVANTMLVGSFAYASSTSGWTAPPGMTEAVDRKSHAATGNDGISIEMAWQVRAATGNTGSKTATASTTAGATADAGNAHLLALRPAALAHYAISGVTAGLTCQASDVTITAHNATHGAVSAPAGTVVNLSTSTGTGVWQSPIVTGPGTWTPSGLNNGVASYTWTGAEISFTVRLRHTTAVTLSINLLDGGSRTEHATEDPAFSFADTGFRVTADGVTTATVGTHIAGKNSNAGFGAQTLYLQAVRTDTSTFSCTGVFGSQTVAVEMAGARINPSGGASQVSVQNSGGGMQAITTSAGAPAGYTSVSLAFDAQSKAPLVFNYPDAGSISLHARYLLPSPPASTYMSGSSNTFVVRPFGLRISVSGVNTGQTGPGDPPSVKAGANFNATVAAVVWKTGDDTDVNGVPDSEAQISGNTATPNFGQEAAAATACLGSKIASPAGGVDGAIGGGTSCTVSAFPLAGDSLSGATISGFASGSKTQAVNYSEVGIINLYAQAQNYLGSGANVTNSAAGLTGVGRFYPDHFFLAAGSTLTNRQAAACAPASSFTYLGEGVGLAFTLQARNTAGAVTQNYTTASGFAKLNPATIASLGLGAVSGATNLSSRLDTSLGSAGSFVAGAAAITAAPGVRRATPDNPDGPFIAARVGIAPVDSDSVAIRAADFNMDVDGAGGNDHQQVGANTELRYGRLRLTNAVGSEKLALPVAVEAQYWQGKGFVTNALDSCTALPRSAIVLGAYTGALAPGGGNCKTFVQQDPVSFASGVGTLTLAAPAGAVSGSVLLTPNLGSVATGSYCDNATSGEDAATAAALSYLLGRWNDAANPDGNANTAYDDDPFARAAFGLYGSQPKNFIYFRENY